MTIRDDIYKDYQKGGKAYATLRGGLVPEFIEFIDKSNFKGGISLDIGCGNGKYLTYLKNMGYKVSGIDSSPTAVKMTKEALGGEDDISCADMYTMNIKPKAFDLIISIRTIHHGRKQDIHKLIHKIHEALSTKGQIFITLPTIGNSNHRDSFTDKEEIAPGTFIPLSGPEKGLPHSFFIQEEIQQIFSEFKNVLRKLDEQGLWVITGEK